MGQTCILQNTLGIGSSKMLSLLQTWCHTVNLHIHRESSNICLFSGQQNIFTATKQSSTNTPAQTHSMQKVLFFYSLRAGFGIYVVISMYVTLSSWLGLFPWPACISWSARKRSPYDCWDFPRIINWLRLSFTKKEGAWHLLCGGLCQWAERRPNTNMTRCVRLGGKTAKTAVAHEMKFSPNFVLCIENIKKACVVVVA